MEIKRKGKKINFREKPAIFWNFALKGSYYPAMLEDDSTQFDFSDSQIPSSQEYFFLVIADRRNRIDFGNSVIKFLRDYGSCNVPENISRGNVKNSSFPYSLWSVVSSTQPNLLEAKIFPLASRSGIFQVRRDREIYRRVENSNSALVDYVSKKLG